MNTLRAISLSCFFALIILPVTAQAVSFSADAIQIRDGEFSHARMFWSDGRVRFEYLDNGMSMARIYDVKNKKVIWLDIENKRFIEKELNVDQNLDPILKQAKKTSNPCDVMQGVECTRLKEAYIDGRKTVKWLITSQYQGEDFHTFQWVDKQYGVVVRQENLDGSLLEVSIDDQQEMNGRKVRKLDFFTVSNERRAHSAQWYDSELNIMVRQLYQNGAEDELRNIKVEKIGNKMFSIPKGYIEYGAETLAAESDTSTIIIPVNSVNN